MNLSDPSNLLITAIYILIVGVMIVFAFFGIFILIKRGESKLFSLISAFIFSIMFFGVLFESFKSLLKVTGN